MSRLEHYQKYHFWYVAGMILLYFAINNTILATSVIMEASRNGREPGFELWEPFLWEYSSAVGTILILWPLFKFLDKKPFSWQKIGRSVLVFLLGSVVYSLCHVGIMVSIRKVVYWSISRSYDFGNVAFELLYEFRKDIWGFVFILMIYYSYQFILSRLLGEANLVADGEDKSDGAECDRLLIKKLGKEFIIKVSDIEWLESSGNYVNLHIQGRIYPTRSTLSKLVEQISNKGFCRIHRSHAINLDAVDSITPLSSGDSEVKLTNGKVLNLSRRYKDELKQRLH